MIDYGIKSPKRPVKKRCQKCGRVGFFRPRETKCKYRTFGAGSYCCWGDLVSLLNLRTKTVSNVGDRFRQRAVKQLTRANQTLRRWQSRLKRDSKLVHKWELRMAQWERKAQYTDEQVEMLRRRAAHAAHVQRVRRRLLGAAEKVETP